MKPTQLKTYRARLKAMRDELHQDSETTADARKPVQLDQTAVGRLSRMDALQVQAMQVETERRRHVEMQRIEAALARIDEEEFGYCAICGEDIEPKRLEHDPTVPACIACARGA
jgi:DnaK suppressor protein